MTAIYIIFGILLIVNIVFDAFDIILLKKYKKKIDDKVESLLLAVSDLSIKVDAVQKSKENFDKTTELISKEHRFLVNELNKANDAITIMNNGFTVAGARADNLWDNFNEVIK